MEVVKRTLRHLNPGVAREVARNPGMLAYYAGRFFCGMIAELETPTGIFNLEEMKPITQSGLMYAVIGEQKRLLGLGTVARHRAYLFPPHSQFCWTVEDDNTANAASKFAFTAGTTGVAFSGPTFWFEPELEIPSTDYDIPGLIEFHKEQGINTDETWDIEVLNNGMIHGGKTLVDFEPPEVFLHKGALHFAGGAIRGIRNYDELVAAGGTGELVIGTAGLITETSTAETLEAIATDLSENMNTYSCLTLFYADPEATTPLYSAFVRHDITSLASVQAANALLASTVGAGHFEAYLLEMQRSGAYVCNARGAGIHNFPGGGFQRYFQFGAVIPELEER